MPTNKNQIKNTPSAPPYKRLDFVSRLDIQTGLATGDSFAKIARDIGVAASTVSREVLRWRIKDASANWAGRPGRCVIKKDCAHKGLCGLCADRLCKGCKVGCRAYCKDYVAPVCPKLQGPPYVCNGCDIARRRKCLVARYFYDAKVAHSGAETLRSASRRGIDLTHDELAALDTLLTPLIRKGQSLEEIYLTHADEIPVTVRTLYAYVDAGALGGLCNADLCRKIRYLPRCRKRQRKARDVPERTYADFCALPTGVQASATEMDTVKGRIGGKAILTLYARRFELMPMFLIEDETHDEIMERLCWVALCMELAEEPDYDTGPDGETVEIRQRSLGDFFPTILTDNGSCFLGFADIEDLGGGHVDGSRKTTVYYCDPYSSYQKGGIERGHEYIREVLPKGTSFDHLEHEDISLLASHVNSIPRPALGGKSSYDLAEAWLGKDLLASMGIRRIVPDDIVRKPWLLPAPPKEEKDSAEN